jgi:hypothetical protein
LACQPYRSFGPGLPWLTGSPARPRTPTMRPSLTATSMASPLECSSEAACTQWSTSDSASPSASRVSTRTVQDFPAA